jgi:hypothetical protein
MPRSLANGAPQSIRWPHITPRQHSSDPLPYLHLLLPPVAQSIVLASPPLGFLGLVPPSNRPILKPIKHPVLLSRLTFAGAVLVASASHCDAALVTMVASNISGQSWNTSAGWSNSSAPSAVNDYFVGTSTSPTTVYTVRAPSTDSTFGGNSLTLSGGQLNLTSAINTIPDLRVQNGGVVLNPVGGTTRELAGGLSFQGDNVIRTAGSASNNIRNILISSTITGGGTVRVLQHGTVTLTNASNTFGGTWHTGGSAFYHTDAGGATFANTADTPTTFTANAGGMGGGGALGLNSNVIVDLYSILNVSYDWVTSGSLALVNNTGVNTAVRMSLTHHHTVGSLNIAGNPLAAGLYDYTRFANEGFGNYFISGAGSITVIPEPASASLLGLGLSLAVARRQRRKP